MRTAQLAWAALCTALLMAAYGAAPKAAPIPERPGSAAAPARAGDKWEYCELQFSTRITRAARGGGGAAGFPGGGFPGGGGRGGAGGGGRGGAGGAGAPGGAGAMPALAAVPRTTIQWSTGEEDVQATSWDDLATKMKIPQAKKDAKTPASKMKVLNYLGGQGWELVSHHEPLTSGATVWTFKRKVGK